MTRASDYDSYKDLTPSPTKVPIKANKDNHTKMPAKYLIMSIENKEIPKAIKAI